MPSTNDVRHAVARSTGTTTWTRKDGDEWKIDCLNHKAGTKAPSRGKAWTTGAHPESFCPKCKVIAAGKADKVADDRLPIPTPTTSKKAAAKPAVAAARKTPTSKKAS